MAFKYGVLLFLFWFLLSGHYGLLLLGLGLASVVLTIFLMKRMNVIDHESYPIHLSPHMPAFIVYIMREIVSANIDVIKRIVSPGSNPISPQMIELPLPQKTDLGRVIYANSITLTPGTVSVNLDKDTILVHALAKETADELATGKMANAIPDYSVRQEGR